MNNNMLQKIYPYLAKQILEDYGIIEGICLDIGTGPGALGIELARISRLKVYLVDISYEAVEKSKHNAKKAGVRHKVVPVRMDVEDMSFPDMFANLIVSRGSLWFWNDKAAGLREIFRVLAPGGIALVGGGLGRKLPEKYRKPLEEEREEKKKIKDWMRIRSADYLKAILSRAGIHSYRLITDPPMGRWIEMHKE